ncbi:hypothetical protein BH23VER1_BH23VER1_31850 [soil metagenome]
MSPRQKRQASPRTRGQEAGFSPPDVEGRDGIGAEANRVKALAQRCLRLQQRVEQLEGFLRAKTIPIPQPPNGPAFGREPPENGNATAPITHFGSGPAAGHPGESRSEVARHAAAVAALQAELAQISDKLWALRSQAGDGSRKIAEELVRRESALINELMRLRREAPDLERALSQGDRGGSGAED